MIGSQKETSISTIRLVIRNGIFALKAFQLETPPIWAPVQMHMPTGRRGQADHQVQNGHQSKVDRVHANSRCHRQQHREGDQDRRQTFHKHAHKDQHEVDQQDNEDAVLVMLRIAVATFCGMRSLVRMNANTFARPIRMMMEEQERILV